MFSVIFRALNQSKSEGEISLASNTYGCHLCLCDDLILGAAVSRSNLGYAEHEVALGVRESYDANRY